MKQAYSYLRFSSPSQSAGDSLRRQRQWSETFAKQHKLILNTSLRFDDKGKSAFRSKNLIVGALGEFIRHVETGTIAAGSVLLVESLDRLSRAKVSDAVQLFLRIINLGVEIVTREPQEHFSKASIDDNTAKLFIALAVMQRAHEESATKSMRSSEAKERAREEARKSKTPLGKLCSCWLRIKEDGSGFQLIPERAKVVRKIFEMSIAGLGLHKITKTLNRSGVAYFSRGDHPKSQQREWDTRSIQRILTSRAAIGEHQPFKFVEGKRVAAGEAIAGYYPAVVSDAVFYKSQAAAESRFQRGSPIGPTVANLFSGLLRDARNGGTLTFLYKGAKLPHPKLVSSLAHRGAQCDDGQPAVWMPILYQPFESMVLHFLWRVDLSSVLPPKANESALRAMIDDKGAELAKTKRKLAQIKTKLLEQDEIEALVEVARELGDRQKALIGGIEELKASLSNAADMHPISDLRQFREIFYAAEGEERIALRLKVRAILQRAISEIWVLPYTLEDGSTAAQVQIMFREGSWERFDLGKIALTPFDPKSRKSLLKGRKTIGGDFVRMFKQFKLDLRDWRKTPTKKRVIA